MKITPYNPKPDATLWLDPFTGELVRPNGTGFPPKSEPGALTLRQVLATAAWAHATRVMLTGATLPREWFLSELDGGWEHGRHHLDHETPTGRYTHTGAGVTVEVRRAAEWFGAGTYSPRDAARAWEVTRQALHSASRTGVGMYRSPGGTGIDYWLRSRGGDVPEPLDDDVQTLIRETSPQHRIELREPVQDEMPALWVLDGRWMYAALTSGVAAGPATMLTGRDADSAFRLEPHRRARYLVTWAAPRDWRTIFGSHAPGLLLAQEDDGRWHAPYTGRAWVDAAELHLAVRYEWDVTIHEGLMFQPSGNVLNTWTDRLVRARDTAASIDPLAARAVRAVLLHAVGMFHSAGTTETTVTASPMQRPDGDGWDAPERLDTGAALWTRRRSHATARSLGLRHPELSSQVWGRAHARLLDTPTGTRGVVGGLLSTDSATVVGMYGDALLLTRRPAWADADDGKPGRLRVKGHLCGPVSWPRTAAERDALVRASETAGTCTSGCA